MRGALVGLIAIVAAIPVYWLLKLFRVKHDYDFMDLAGLMIGVLIVGVPAYLLIARFFVLWPFQIDPR